MKTNQLIVIGIIALPLICSCKSIKVISPPVEPPSTPVNSARVSNVTINASISEQDLLLLLKKDIRSPLNEESTLSVRASFDTDQTITIDELYKHVTSPYIPGHWKDVAKKTYKTVRKGFSCIINPFKWGTCYKDVLEAVWTTTKVWVEPQLEQFEWLTRTVLKTIDKLFKIEARVHYPTYLKDANISFAGNQFELIAKFRTDLKFDYEQALIPLGPTLKMNSVVELPVNSKVTVKGNISIIAPGRIAITIDQPATDFDFEPISPGLPVIDGGTIETIVMPKIELIVKPLIEKLADKLINSALNKQIDKNSEKFDFRESLNQLTMMLGEPKLIYKDIWFNARPVKISSGQINGKNKRLNYKASIEFKPEISYGPVYPNVPPQNIPFVVANVANENTYIDLKIKVLKGLVEDTIKAVINEALVEADLEKAFRINDVSIFNTSASKIAVKVDIQMRHIFGKYAHFANAYLSGNLNYDNLTGIFSFTNVAFTVETVNKLASSLITSLISKSVETKISERAQFSIRDEIRVVNSALKDTTIVLKYGSVNLQFKPILFSNPYLTENNLEVNSLLEGRLNLNLDKSPNPLYSYEFPNDQLKVELKKQPKVKSDRRDYIIDRERINISHELSQNNLNRELTDFDRIDFNTNLSIASLSMQENDYLTSLRIGDTIYVEKDGVITKEVFTYQDSMFNSEEIIIEPIPGKLERLRINRAPNLKGASEVRLAPKEISINEAINNIDNEVIVKGTLKCKKVFTDLSGEEVCNLMLDQCDNKIIWIKIYLGSVDFDPNEDIIDSVFKIEGILDLENGIPLLRVRENGKISFTP